jgi:hypothetical protein
VATVRSTDPDIVTAHGLLRWTGLDGVRDPLQLLVVAGVNVRCWDINEKSACGSDGSPVGRCSPTPIKAERPCFVRDASSLLDSQARTCGAARSVMVVIPGSAARNQCDRATLQIDNSGRHCGMTYLA